MTAKRSLISLSYTPNHPQRDRRGCGQSAREPYQETGGRFSDRAIPVTMSSHLFPRLGALSTEPCRRVLGCAPLPSRPCHDRAGPERWLGNAHWLSVFCAFASSRSTESLERVHRNLYMLFLAPTVVIRWPSPTSMVHKNLLAACCDPSWPTSRCTSERSTTRGGV